MFRWSTLADLGGLVLEKSFRFDPVERLTNVSVDCKLERHSIKPDIEIFMSGLGRSSL